MVQTDFIFPSGHLSRQLLVLALAISAKINTYIFKQKGCVKCKYHPVSIQESRIISVSGQGLLFLAFGHEAVLNIIKPHTF